MQECSETAFKPGGRRRDRWCTFSSSGCKTGWKTRSEPPRKWDLYGFYEGVCESSLSSGVDSRNRFYRSGCVPPYARKSLGMRE